MTKPCRHYLSSHGSTSTGSGNKKLLRKHKEVSHVLTEFPCTCLELSSLCSVFDPLLCRTGKVVPAAWHLAVMKFVLPKDTSVELALCYPGGAGAEKMPLFAHPWYFQVGEMGTVLQCIAELWC